MSTYANEEMIRKVNQKLEKVPVPTVEDMRKAYSITTVWFWVVLTINSFILFVLNFDNTSFASHIIKNAFEFEDFLYLVQLLTVILAILLEISGLIIIIKRVCAKEKYEISILEHESVCYKSTLNLFTNSILSAYLLIMSCYMLAITEELNSVAEAAPMILVLMYFIVITIAALLIFNLKVLKRARLLNQLVVAGTTGVNSSKDIVKEKTDNMDILIKYKSLLDSGAITAEEFEEKKKELLNNSDK